MRSDISGINTQMRPHDPHAGILKQEIAVFKSQYDIFMSKYESSGQVTLTTLVSLKIERPTLCMHSVSCESIWCFRF